MQEIRDYAALMFTRREIALIIDVSYDQFLDMLENRGGDVYRSFQASRLKEEALIRRAVLDLAKAGSSPAQTAALKLIENAKLDDL